MAFLKRLSDNFWSYVSPTKTKAGSEDKTRTTTPQTLPKFKKPARAVAIDDVLARSMSSEERVENWRVRGTTSDTSSEGARKRKRVEPVVVTARAATTSPTKRGVGRPRKFIKMEDVDMDDEFLLEWEDDGDVSMEDGGRYEDVEEEDDDDDDEEEMSEDETGPEDNIHVATPSSASKSPSKRRMKSMSKSPSKRHLKVPSKSPSKSPSQYDLSFETTEIEDSRVIPESEYQYESPRRKLVSPTEEHLSRGVSTEELRAQGWDDDHIVLVQKIAMRGFEPLMPRYWHFAYRFHMPEGLFVAEGDNTDAIISSVRNEHHRAMMALDKLFELGGWMRDRVELQGRIRPEQQVRKSLNEYIKWAQEDSRLDQNTAIPLLAIETKPADFDSQIIMGNAKRKLARLASRYREAFRVSQSIENSPASHTSTVLSCPVPTLYAIVASHTLIALAAYNPEDKEPDITNIAMLNMRDRSRDVWNALALAIVVCHVRNVQMRIAEDTGLGLMSVAGDERRVEVEGDDPDA